MENSFLIDVNLPKFFKFFNSKNFVFVADLNLKMSDSEIWNYALQQNLVIVTKDVDFYDRVLLSEIAPKIIYFQIGNFTLKQLHSFFEVNWDKITLEINYCSMLIVKQSHFEYIS